MMKALYHELSSPGGRSSATIKKQAEHLGKLIENGMRMSFATESQFKGWKLRHARDNARKCRACGLCRSREKVVFGSGYTDADIMLVGDYPSEESDRAGKAFVGKEGRIIDGVLAKAGLSRRQVFATNMVLCHTGGRRPSNPEIKACQHRLVDAVEIVLPKVIIIMGKTAATWAGIHLSEETRGELPPSEWPDLNPGVYAELRGVFATVHPRFILSRKTRALKSSWLRAFAEDVSDAVAKATEAPW